MFSKIFCLSFFMISTAFASYEAADRNYGKGTISLAGYRRTIIELVNDGYYFSTVPWMKDFIVKTDRPLDGSMEEAVLNDLTDRERILIANRP